MAFSQKSDHEESGDNNYNIEQNIGDVDESERMDSIVELVHAGRFKSSISWSEIPTSRYSISS